MKTFEFAPGLNLRVIDRDGKPWFLAKDVCLALDLSPDKGNGSLQNHMRPLDPAERTTAPVATSGSTTRKQYIISESGLYSLILKSRKPEAKVFKKWVTSEVLPTIRKTGGYMAPSVAVLAEEDPAAFMAHALLIAQETINGLKVQAINKSHTLGNPTGIHRGSVG